MGSFDRGILTYQSVVVRIGSTGGYADLSAGTSTLSGSLELYSPKGIRQGYIGSSSTTATADAGTIPYVAGTHAFSGLTTFSSTVTALGNIRGPLVVGYTDASTGYCGCNVGNSTNSGYVMFYSPSQVRQGYIGFSSTTATADAGTIPYVAGTHAFTGVISGGVIACSNYIQVSSGAANASLYLDSNATLGKYIQMRTGVLARWILGTDTSAESGSNVGSNFFINRYNDAGTYIDTPFILNRATGYVTFSARVTAAEFTGPATALQSVSGSVNVSASAAPSVGQTLVATASNTATWQTVSGVPDFILINAGII